MKRIIVALGLVVVGVTPLMAFSAIEQIPLSEAPRPWVLTGAWASVAVPGEVQMPVQWLYTRQDWCNEDAAVYEAASGFQTWCIQPEYKR